MYGNKTMLKLIALQNRLFSSTAKFLFLCKTLLQYDINYDYTVTPFLYIWILDSQQFKDIFQTFSQTNCMNTTIIYTYITYIQFQLIIVKFLSFSIKFKKRICGMCMYRNMHKSVYHANRFRKLENFNPQLCRVCTICFFNFVPL